MLDDNKDGVCHVIQHGGDDVTSNQDVTLIYCFISTVKD
jgi:hypothetical protein